MVQPASHIAPQRSKLRLRIVLRGVVQGVGFRPFVYRLAEAMGLCGWVRNDSGGLTIEVEAEKETLDHFFLRLQAEKPSKAVVTGCEISFLDPVGYSEFMIRPSETHSEELTLMLPDVATCPDCLRELFDPTNRRYRYPFITCTHCGPRFTIIEKLPYDRPNTTMRDFPMCESCRREYEDPNDRRFHAQPIACPDCGPHLEWLDAYGKCVALKEEALAAAIEALRGGRIAALKGIGGFQLLVDASNDEAVAALRRRKHREEKPFALMAPDLAAAGRMCLISPFEERLLCSPESPIVLMRRRADAPVSSLVAPDNPYLGIMLPYSPLHHLLLREFGSTVVATSGNLSEEPIVIDEREAVRKLTGVADGFLVHNRRIVRHADDSIVRIVNGREMVLRRARGYAPLPIEVGRSAGKAIAVGGHLKNTVAVRIDNRLVISQHIGDLATAEAADAFERVIDDLDRIYRLDGAPAVCDLHPEYISTKFARRRFPQVTAVQHHAAHIAACMAENQLEPPLLGVAWDGIGYGTDGLLWGGEFFIVDESFQHAAQFLPFPLPGGEQAIREPRRTALGMLYELFGEAMFEQDLPIFEAFSRGELALLRQMLARGVNCPRSSGVGRLFDGAAALLGLRLRSSFEGQAAMALEWRAAEGINDHYPFELLPGSPAIVDWRPMLDALLQDMENGQVVALTAAKFHNTLAEIICRAAEQFSMEKVVLSGGVFQNVRLLTEAAERLERRGFRPYWHQRIPPNDGGIAAGQLILFEMLQKKES
ncbi:MAG: carbamoyltransferase HypF [candidate division KSB1 bacterium]|nr:carbamoyltransferase HypF [candidate division KSB1 bacterium]